MNDQIKNRVVGTVVIFTLAIIFLPDIFDGKKNELKENFAVIPARPIVDDTASKTRDVVLKQRDVDTTQTPEPAPTAEPTSTVVTKALEKHKDLTKKQTFKRAGWVIQMGIFKEASRVKPYLTKLRKQGFTAFSVPHNPRRGESTTVYIGPNLDKNVLVKLQPKLKKAFNESGYIKPFNPVSHQGN